jgi:hypothetical protein
MTGKRHARAAIGEILAKMMDVKPPSKRMGIQILEGSWRIFRSWAIGDPTGQRGLGQAYSDEMRSWGPSLSISDPKCA